MSANDTSLEETCCCGAALKVAGTWSSVSSRQNDFHRQHRGHKAPPTPSLVKEHEVVFTDPYEIVCACGAVLACGGFLDSATKAFGRHLRSVRGVDE